MTTKMRVRELSAELGVSNKELLHLLREQNIQVKSHMSGLSDEEVELVRQKLSAQSEEQYTQNTMTSSGVIVRRRRHGRRARTSEESPPAREAKTSETEAPVESTEAPAAERHGEEASAGPEVEAPEQGTAAQEPAESEIGEPESPSQEAVSSEEAESEEETPAKGKRKKRGKRKKKEVTPPNVTVISRPEAPPEEERTDKAAPEQAVPAAQAKDQESGPETDKKQKKKDKRVVDVSSLYEEKEQRQDKVAWKKQKHKEVKDKTGGKEPLKRKPSGFKGKPKKSPEAQPQPATQPQKAAKRKIRMEEAVRVSDLAQEMGVKAQEIIKTLMELGIMATINQSLDVDTASIVAAEFGYEVEKVGFSEEEFILPQKEDRPEELVHRPPVVTIMGHVDHGKTSLLDAIRKSHITDKEAGGITQHIGAYHVNMDGNPIIFLDTPGHEAFTEMRSRGAQVTDLVILIVAADDGVMDQTKEAINHAKAAGVPIIVAVNKIDKDNADTDRVKRELADHGLISEEWGGETIFSYVSAKQRTGLEQLLEMILLQSEMLELKANPDKRARGHIIEAQLDKGRGPVGTVLIQEGTLSATDPFVCGVFHGRVRAMLNDRGQKIDSAGPSMPVEVQGFEGVPNAGDEFVVVENEKVARRIAEARQLKQREKELAKESKVTLESFFQAKQEEEIKALNLVLKADVQGSLEAISEAIHQLSTEEVKVKIIHGGIGAITESDIKLATASSAVIIGFNVRPSSKVKDTAEQEGVDIRFYTVIYQLVNEVKEAMAGMLSPVTKEVYLGQAEVRETFTIPKVGTIAGCFVLDGKLQRNAGIRLIRDGVVMYTGKLSSLKRFKDDAKEVTKDYECGVGLEKFNDIKEGDIIEAFEEVQERPTLG